MKAPTIGGCAMLMSDVPGDVSDPAWAERLGAEVSPFVAPHEARRLSGDSGATSHTHANP